MAYQPVERWQQSIGVGPQQGEPLRIISELGFGTFQVKTRAARVGTHPASGDRINIPEKQHVVFKPGKTLREVIVG